MTHDQTMPPSAGERVSSPFSEDAQRALASRDKIGQAKGILMERYGIDEVAAFAVLVRHSQETNRRVREVAELLVATRRLPDRPRNSSSVVGEEDHTAADPDGHGHSDAPPPRGHNASR